MPKSSTKTSKKVTAVTTPHAISKKKTLSTKKSAPKAANSAFTKTVTLFRNAKDVFSIDSKYKKW